MVCVLNAKLDIILLKVQAQIHQIHVVNANHHVLLAVMEQLVIHVQQVHYLKIINVMLVHQIV